VLNNFECEVIFMACPQRILECHLSRHHRKENTKSIVISGEKNSEAEEM
jgi:hypothetical protein